MERLTSEGFELPKKLFERRVLGESVREPKKGKRRA
jgi:hypothetical protein